MFYLQNSLGSLHWMSFMNTYFVHFLFSLATWNSGNFHCEVFKLCLIQIEVIARAFCSRYKETFNICSPFLKIFCIVFRGLKMVQCGYSFRVRISCISFTLINYNMCDWKSQTESAWQFTAKMKYCDETLTNYIYWSTCHTIHYFNWPNSNYFTSNSTKHSVSSALFICKLTSNPNYTDELIFVE
jgi:hypothetical protein